MAKKKLWKTLLVTSLCTILMALCLFSIGIDAQATNTSYLTFELNDDLKSYYVSDCSSFASGDLVIPAKYNGKPVTSIGDFAFARCTKLTGITIPNSIKTIGDYAFQSCTSLTSIIIPNKVTSIGSYAFSYCNRLCSITIPNSVTSVGDDAFTNCNTQAYTVYDNAKYIGNKENPYLVLVESRSDAIIFCDIPQTTKIIMDEAFSWCDRLRSITIPNSVISIGYKAFQGCSSLTDAAIGNNVKNIGSYAFSLCRSLTNITIPESVKSIGLLAFESCSKLSKIYFQGNAPSVDLLITYGMDITAYYPQNNDTWDKILSSDEYYGRISNWQAYKLFKITNQPSSKAVKAGATAKFTTKANDSKVTYQWQYRTSSKGSWKNASATGNKTKTLSVSATTAKNGYQYRCRVTDNAGNKVYTKVVTLNVLGIKTQPANKTVVTGKTAKFTVSAVGKGLSYQWQYRTSSSGSWKNASATGNKSASLSVAATTSKHGYQYRCRIKDSAGNTIYTNTVSLYVLGIKTQPASKTVKVGATAKFTVSAVGRGLTYQWQYKTSSSGSWKNVSSTVGKKASYSLTAAARHNGYQYRCRIKDSAGNVIYSKTVKLTVK